MCSIGWSSSSDKGLPQWPSDLAANNSSKSVGSQVYDGAGRPGSRRMASAFFALYAAHLCLWRSLYMSSRSAKRQVWHLTRRFRCALARMCAFRFDIAPCFSLCAHAPILHTFPSFPKALYFSLR
ncbi:hypothetical protein GSI_00157 [Ganoderma sinense ZZ0214-1]|uniref:Uncharacterized protein n=1 Tax=Ganoderma sinense ZZ0214-1 TaxID=1077348 RepID=A0A2G8SSB7_9APHY|nr:hypothetical protein GSI_00157 [Ganoderma sinense ZZ0214-1]